VENRSGAEARDNDKIRSLDAVEHGGQSKGDSESARGIERTHQSPGRRRCQTWCNCTTAPYRVRLLSTPGRLGRRRPLRAVARSASRHTYAQSAPASSVRIVSNQGSGAFACARGPGYGPAENEKISAQAAALGGVISFGAVRRTVSGLWCSVSMSCRGPAERTRKLGERTEV